MSYLDISSEIWAATCNNDGEFRLAARYWDGGLTLDLGPRKLSITLSNGEASSDAPAANDQPAAGSSHAAGAIIGFKADASLWDKILAPVPPRLHNDIMSNLSTRTGLSRIGDPLTHAQYYAAAMRALELLRDTPANETANEPVSNAGMFDTPVGRYVHLDLQGHDHRLYYEEAGRGIPMLLQHTAGCHGSQWRHLFENPEITSHFRLIAYDLPYHGKSLPPSGKAWWQETYNLEGEFLRSIPLALAEALELDRPVFMGCSVGGLLALDLAYRHPDAFRAVISVEGALNIEGDLKHNQEFWHPQVSNEYKARAMEGLTSPTSPLPYRKETGFVYASGWPQAFLGDLHYYVNDYDLRSVAADIDTAKTAVHILSGEYDWSGRSELGQEAHEVIKGSTWAEMKGVGHFPMSENPAVFMSYLKPILSSILSAT